MCYGFTAADRANYNTLSLYHTPPLPPAFTHILPRYLKKWEHRIKNRATWFNTAIILLVYPLSARYILRGFVCTSYITGDGQTTRWLADDLAIECNVRDNPRYAFILAYSSAMTLIIIVGLPAALVAVLWPWRFPIDRLHTSTEEGRREPSQLAEDAIGPSFTLYRPGYWTTDSAELLSKMLLTSLVGVIFGSKTQQLRGLVVCVVLCCALLILYMQLRPLRYDRGNTYKAIMYVEESFILFSVAKQIH